MSAMLQLSRIILLFGSVSLSLGHNSSNVWPPEYKTHPCMRECTPGDTQVCAYTFVAEYYHTLSQVCGDCPFNESHCDRPQCIPGDGVSRPVLVINRMLPGPAIHVCQSDIVIVTVYNHLSGGEGLSIHWHGMLQKGSQHMDGVSMVTQCPIASSSSFTYSFRADHAGTHYYHAHSGLQRTDGIYGAFIVRQPRDIEVHNSLYDHDSYQHTILMADWIEELAVNRLTSHTHGGKDNRPASILINGRGSFKHIMNNNGQHKSIPPKVFEVERGKRYRFRLISNGALNCPLQFSVDNHTLTAIATDGNPFKAIEVQSLNIFAGERFDVVLHANQPVENYWIRVRGEADCIPKQANEGAILRYKGAELHHPHAALLYEDARRSGKKLNPWNKKSNENLLSVDKLTSLLPNSRAVQDVTDKKFYLAMDFHQVTDPRIYNPAGSTHDHHAMSSETGSDNPLGDKITTHHHMSMTTNPSTMEHHHRDTTMSLHTHAMSDSDTDDMPTVMSMTMSDGSMDHSMHQSGTGMTSMDHGDGHDHSFIPQINHMSGGLPSAPLLTQFEDVSEEDFCDYHMKTKDCTQELCKCVHLIKVDLGDVVELVLIDEGRAYDDNHPMHLHGHTFVVVGMDRINSSTSLKEVRDLDEQGLLKRNLIDPVVKDTVTVPDGGYVILRWHADNPGFWFLHCHLEFHMHMGMGMFIQVGERHQMPSTPSHFPMCGDFKPENIYSLVPNPANKIFYDPILLSFVLQTVFAFLQCFK